MAYEQKENSGAIFKNEKREKDTHPNMTGTALIGGVEYFISGWTKEGKNGKWLSLAFKPKEAKPQAQSKPSGGVMDDMADDLPFASSNVSHDLESRISRRMAKYK